MEAAIRDTSLELFAGPVASPWRRAQGFGTVLGSWPRTTGCMCSEALAVFMSCYCCSGVLPLYCTREVVNLVFFWSLLCLNTIFVLMCPLTFFNYCFKLAIVKLYLVNYCISDYAKLVLSWFFCFALRRLRYSVLNCQEVYWLKARCKVMQATSLGFLWEGTSSGWRVTHK